MIIFLILTIILVFSTAALVDQCSIFSGVRSEEDSEEEIIETKEVLDQKEEIEDEAVEEEPDEIMEEEEEQETSDEITDEAEQDSDEEQAEEEEDILLKDAKEEPIIEDIVFSNFLIVPSQKVEVTVIASDPDGDELDYEWEVSAGTIDDINTNSIKWTAPDEEGTFTITVTVYDSDYETTNRSEDVSVQYQQMSGEMYTEATGAKKLQAYESLSGIIFCDQGVYGTPNGETWIGDTDINEVILTYISFIGIDHLNNLENVTITDASLITGPFFNWIGHPELAGDQIFVEAADYGTTLEFEDQNFGGGRTLGTIDNPGLFNITFTSPELINEIQMVLDDPVRHYVQLRLFPDDVNWNHSSDYYRIRYHTMYLHIEYTYTDAQ
jgi:hypothetical protein